MTSLVPTGVPIPVVCAYVNCCVGTFIFPHLGMFFDSRVDTFVISCPSTHVASCSSLVLLGGQPGLYVSAFFDGGHLVLGGAEGNPLSKCGGAGLLAAWLLGPGYNVAVGGLHVVNRLIDGLPLIVGNFSVFSTILAFVSMKSSIWSPAFVSRFTFLVSKVGDRHEVVDGGMYM